MRKIVAFVLISFFVTACAETTKSPMKNEVSENSPIVSSIRGQVVGGCRYLPTAKTVVEILELGFPGLAKATKIAEAICKAVEDGSKGRGVPSVNGVRIRGEFV